LITLRHIGIQLAIQHVSSSMNIYSQTVQILSCLVNLIDSMLVIDRDARFTVDQCLAHPWMNAEDGADRLVHRIAELGVSRRGVARERTLLSASLDLGIAQESTVKAFKKKKLRKGKRDDTSDSESSISSLEEVFTSSK
jgi:serine/threonine protein kinase